MQFHKIITVTLLSFQFMGYHTTMSVGELWGTRTINLVHFSTTIVPSVKTTSLVCPSHKDQYVTVTAISGLTLLAFGKRDLIPTTVPVPKALEAHHHLMWVLTIIATLPLLFMAPHSGTPTTPSGTGRTATLGPTAVLIHDYHGFGGHSNKRQIITSQFDGVLIVESRILTLEQNCWKFTSANSCSTNTHMHTSSILYTHIISLVHI